jgi:hypothetical protein
MTREPSHIYVGVNSDGEVRAYCYDDPGREEDTQQIINDWRRQGRRVERLTIEEASAWMACGCMSPNDLRHPKPVHGRWPYPGMIYAIRGFGPVPGNDGLYLEECVMPLDPAGYEWSFHRGNFRALSKQPDISELRKLVVNPPKETVSA